MELIRDILDRVIYARRVNILSITHTGPVEYVVAPSPVGTHVLIRWEVLEQLVEGLTFGE